MWNKSTVLISSYKNLFLRVQNLGKIFSYNMKKKEVFILSSFCQVLNSLGTSLWFLEQEILQEAPQSQLCCCLRQAEL